MRLLARFDRSERRDVMSDPTRRCGSGGCGRFSVCLVAKSGRFRSVCAKCADEMTALYGWRRL